MPRINDVVQLRFDDGSTLEVTALEICFVSSVLRNAVEANAGADSTTVPVPGITKEQWEEAAAFWQPTRPMAQIKSWTQAEKLLKVGEQLDVWLLLCEVDRYIASNSGDLWWHESHADSWAWLKNADRAGLCACMPAVAARAVAKDKGGCNKDENLQGLSAATLQQLVKALAR